MPALYRTYRPKRFSDVVGQTHIVRTLQNAVVADNPAHAYLFCGGRGLGKTTLARVLARALNCLDVQNGEACLTCRVCREIDAGSFLDMLEVDAASNTGVDNVRSLIDTVRFQPTSGKYKMYIIDEAHMLSKGAWNALLKTLEEPPSRTVFVLATTEAGKVPATINSRAQVFGFNKFSETELVEQLASVLDQEHRTLPKEFLTFIAHAADGGMRDALTLLDQVFSLGPNPAFSDVERLLGKTSRELLFELFRIIRTGTPEELPRFFQELTATYFDMQAVNRDILELLRELLVARLMPMRPEFPTDVATASEWYTEQDLLFLLRQYLRSYKEIPGSPEGSLPLLIASLEALYKIQPSASSGGRVGKSQNSEPGPEAHPATRPSAAPNLVPEIPVPAPSAPQKAVAASVLRNTMVERVATVDETFTLDGQKVRESWSDVCNKLKDINGPLGTLVRNSPICSIEGNSIAIGVKYLFHKEQLESTKNKQLIAQTVSAFFGGPVRVSAQFIEREESSASTGEILTDALKIFGGELVE